MAFVTVRSTLRLKESLPFLFATSLDSSQFVVDLCKGSSVGFTSRLVDRRRAFEDREFFVSFAFDLLFLQTLEAEEVFLVFSFFVLPEPDLFFAIIPIVLTTDLIQYSSHIWRVSDEKPLVAYIKLCAK